MHVGDRVMPRDGLATGTIEEIRPSSPSSDGDYLVAEVLWDSGARCAEPLFWLGRLDDVQAANQAREAETRKAAREAAKERRRELPEQECDGCVRRFTPARRGQRFHSESCRKRARRLGIVGSANHA
jgi:hypothetical protein